MSQADYFGNIVFSTLEMVGSQFDTSLNGGSGYTCPSGYALDLRGDAPACTLHDEVACLNADPETGRRGPRRRFRRSTPTPVTACA